MLLLITVDTGASVGDACFTAFSLALLSSLAMIQINIREPLRGWARQ